MSKLRELVNVAIDEAAVIDFESSLDRDSVVSGYVPVKSTLEVFSFLKQAVAQQSPQGRAVICHGSYGSGKSRLCTVLARLFRDGFDCPALAPIWGRLTAREERDAMEDLRQASMPGGRPWRPWLVVPLYMQGGGGTLSASLIRALVKALRRVGLGEDVLGGTIHAAAWTQLERLLQSKYTYEPAPGSRYATPEQLRRALEEDLDDVALAEVGQFFKDKLGLDLLAILHAQDNGVLDASGVYNTVAQRIQTYGYDGIIIIWDEFGLALEEMLRDAHREVRSLGQETASLQSFLEKACGNIELGKRIVFLGFTHVSISEYGTRERLSENDQRRLDIVSGRFRSPSINIRLSVAEAEGYHLLAGMLRRTEVGDNLFANPVPRLQRLADRMPHFAAWQRYSPASCYDDIVASCYPLHPATSAALLLLSDQIAQINRTTFYYLQDEGAGGLAGILRDRDAPDLNEIGGKELARVSDLFYFFEEAIRNGKRSLHDQYQESLARFPEANDLEKAILRTVLVLSVVADASLAPTTDFLCFCHADARRSDPTAQPVHDALKRLNDAGALWKNEATEVWQFVGGLGLGSQIQQELDRELEMIPDRSPSQLLREHREIQEEITDRLGDFSLDPCESGTVRRIGVRLLDASKDERELEAVNPARIGAAEPWRSALVYLVLADAPSQYAAWYERLGKLSQTGLYFVFPPEAVALDRVAIRELIAVMKLLEKKDPKSHAYQWLDSRYTRLRRELRQQFEQAFDNIGLRAGARILRAGQTSPPLTIDSWSRLLGIVTSDWKELFCHQIRVRCGAFNEWQDSGNWSKIEHIVEQIIKAGEDSTFANWYMDFTETSQEAAIIDGVLVENRLLKQDGGPDSPWRLITVDDKCPVETVREIWKHLTAAGERDFDKLFGRLVEPPYGVPNAVIPLLVSLVFRTEGERIGIYERVGGQLRRIESQSRVIDAFVDMAKRPKHYVTRYTKLTGPQRVVFKAIGPCVGEPFTDRVATGEAFYEYCDKVRKKLREWAEPLPDAVTKAQELTDPERGLLKLLRGTVWPQPPVLADSLVEVIRQDTAASEAIAADASTKSFPAIEAKWRELREKVERYVEGIRAALRKPIREIVESQENDGDSKAAVVRALNALADTSGNDGESHRRIVERLQTVEGGDIVDVVASAIAGLPQTKLTGEDFARAAGRMEAIATLEKQRAEHRKSGVILVTLPSGAVRRLTTPQHSGAAKRIGEDIERWRTDLALPPDQLAYLVIQAVLANDCPTDGEDRSSGQPPCTQGADGVPQS